MEGGGSEGGGEEERRGTPPQEEAMNSQVVLTRQQRTLGLLCYLCRRFVKDTSTVQDMFFAHVSQVRICDSHDIVSSAFYL